jgi:uncharacterized membrane protein YhhN
MQKNKSLQLFIGISCIYLLLIIVGNENWAWFLKPLLLPFLFLMVYQSEQFETKNWLLFALLFSWIGDIFLMFANKDALYFIFGLVSFLIAHILFILLFIKQKSIESTKKNYFFFIALLLVFFYLFGMLFLLIPKLGSLKFPVIIYATTISFMLIVAIKGTFKWVSNSKHWILIGAIFFVTSDSILAINKFHSDVNHALFYIMITYLIAQLLITIGILKLNKKIAFPNENAIVKI